MAGYSTIVFLDGSEADEFFSIKKDKGLDAAMDYLIQWDHGEDHDVRDQSSSGPYDDFMYRDVTDFEYRMAWNLYYGYATLERVKTSETIVEDFQFEN